MSDEGKEARQDTQLLPLEVIRVETALSRFPIHRLAKQGTIRIELREGDDKGEMTVQWEVSYNSKFGQPGPLAYKLDTLVINRKIEAVGRPIPKVVKLGSLREIADATGTGDGNTTTIKHALYQNASAFITAKIGYRANDGTGRRIEIGDTRYAVVFTGETLPDGRTADAVYIVLHDFYREILDNALTRPLDFDYLRELPPAPQRLYELLSYPMFGVIKHGRSKARLVYSEFCTRAPQTRYFDWEHARKQMAKVHAPHRKAGYIAGVEFEATIDREGRPDWTMIYTPGPKAKAEYQVFVKKGGPVVLEAEPVKPEPTGLERELVVCGVSASAAYELVATYPADRIRAQIEHVDWLRAKRPKKIADGGAYLAEAIRKDYAPPVGFEGRAGRMEREQAEQERRQREAEDRRAKARRQEDQARIDAYWQALALEQRVRLEAEAVEQADPAVRARCEAGTPRMRAMARRVIREAHIRDLLDPPVVG